MHNTCMAISPDQIKHTLAAIFREQANPIPAELLDIARVQLEYNGSDYGDDFYTFEMRIPVARFARIEEQLEAISSEIEQKLRRLGVSYEKGIINTVRIYPELMVGPGAISVPVATASDEKRLWKPGKIRVFLSHVSRVKDDVGAVKQALLPLGVDAFVAHEDIEPQQQWHREIEIALGTMDVLCAFVTPDFATSKWCDQETGYALGRGVPVIAVNYGAQPHGLLGKQQSIGGDNRVAAVCAAKIADVMAQQEHLQARFTEAIVEAVATANSSQDAEEGAKRLATFQEYLSDDQIKRLLVAAKENSQVREAMGVPGKIEAIAKERKVTLPPPKPASDFDDDIPF
jgi:hypothetical protein